jgi:Ca2+-binding EF-hand superfamily protein
MPLASRYVCALFQYFDKDRTGRIEFEQFERFILYEPFSV